MGCSCWGLGRDCVEQGVGVEPVWTHVGLTSSCDSATYQPATSVGPVPFLSLSFFLCKEDNHASLPGLLRE